MKKLLHPATETHVKGDVNITFNPIKTAKIIVDTVVEANAPWSAIIRRGQHLRLIDSHGHKWSILLTSTMALAAQNVRDDPGQTWFHIDPRTCEMLGRLDSSRRSYRWLFNAQHSLIFPCCCAIALRGTQSYGCCHCWE
ncbi:hypothetical protein [Bradyrhizobium sp. STM 3561]|uniref:hypothetical protein n=1 Tax=Bradyrhizobium sp. STM 3561 TaxID=578923 RepID=UPI00388F6E8C